MKVKLTDHAIWVSISCRYLPVSALESLTSRLIYANLPYMCSQRDLLLKQVHSTASAGLYAAQLLLSIARKISGFYGVIADLNWYLELNLIDLKYTAISPNWSVNEQPELLDFRKISKRTQNSLSLSLPIYLSSHVIIISGANIYLRYHRTEVNECTTSFNRSPFKDQLAKHLSLQDLFLLPWTRLLIALNSLFLNDLWATRNTFEKHTIENWSGRVL